MHSYIVSSLRPAAVGDTVMGHWTNGGVDLNLIVARTHNIQVYIVQSDGLKLHLDIPILGRIESVKLFRPHKMNHDVMFVLTSKYDASVLEHSAATNSVKTLAHANISDNVAREATNGTIVAVDPISQCIGVRIYDGVLKLIEWQPSDGQHLKTTNIRFDDLNIRDLAFLHGYDQPTVAYIHQDHTEKCRHLKTVTIGKDKEFKTGPLQQENIQAEATMIIAIPPPSNGCVIIGRQSISYHRSNDDYCAITPPLLSQSTILCAGRIDQNRLLLGDMLGRLFLLQLECSSGDPELQCASSSSMVTNLKLEMLGEATIAESLCYVGDGVVFVGSRLGDSQLVKLKSDDATAENGTSYVQLLETFPNLGPIVDMAMIDTDAQTHLVTCSNAYKEGSLRVVRNGIGIQELASVDLPAIKGVFPVAYAVPLSEQSFTHNMLIVSSVEHTRLLQLNGEEMEEMELEGVPANEQTLAAVNVSNAANQRRFILMATTHCVRLIDAQANAPKSLLHSWTPPDGVRISLASINEETGQTVVTWGTTLLYLTVDTAAEQIVVVKQTTLPHEAACVDISPIGACELHADLCKLGRGTAESQLCCVGLWTDISIIMFTLPDLKTLHTEALGGEMLARSCLLCRFDAQIYVLVAMGDGTVFYFSINEENGGLRERKKVTLGTQPVQLKKFTHDAEHVFACSDRPTVIYSLNNKLIFANVNVKHVGTMCPLDAQAYRRSLVMCDATTMTIGTIDEIQKMHIRTVPLGETVTRVAHQPSTNTLGLLTNRAELRTTPKPIFAPNMTQQKSNASAPNERTSVPFRESASTLAPNKSTSGASNMPIAPPSTTAAAGSSAMDHGDMMRNYPLGAHAESIETEVEVHNVLIVDANTFEVQHAHELGANEMAISIMSCTLGDDPQSYYVVGTATVNDEENEAKIGRILVFAYTTDGRLNLVHEKDVKGAPYALVPFRGKILAAINAAVRLFEWTADKELAVECSTFNYVAALFLKCKGDFVLSGDLQRSINVLNYRKVEGSFEEIARDYKSEWMVAVEIIDDDNYLGAQNENNLFTSHKDSAAVSDEERVKLQQSGQYHLGQMVNVFTHGTLVMQSRQTNALLHTPIMYGTVDGGIGCIMQMNEPLFGILDQVQRRFAKQHQPVGKIDWVSWRENTCERRVEPMKGFIDGDLLEQILDISREQVARLCEGMHWPSEVVTQLNVEGYNLSTEGEEGMAEGETRKCPMKADDLIKLIDEFSRMH